MLQTPEYMGMGRDGVRISVGNQWENQHSEQQGLLEATIKHSTAQHSTAHTDLLAPFELPERISSLTAGCCDCCGSWPPGVTGMLGERVCGEDVQIQAEGWLGDGRGMVRG